MTQLRPIRTYAITVEGYDSVIYSARSPAKARWRCFQDFGVVSSCSFTEFLARSTIRRVPEPDGIGERITVLGKPATTVVGRSPCGIYFIYDDGDAILTAHPSDVSRVSGELIEGAKP